MRKKKQISDLVIGGNLKALEFAFREGFPVFYERLEVPFHLEQTKEGLSKKDIIETYAFLLSMAGLNCNSKGIESHRLEEQSIFLTGKGAWAKEITFDKLHDFREENDSFFKVVDFINVRSCGPHDVRELKTEENFVKEIYFYPSERVNSSKNFSLSTHNYETVTKDAMVISYLQKEDLENENYSPVYSRLRLKEIMKEVGIQGKRCGKRPNGSIKRNAIKLEFEKRQINLIEKDERNYYYTESKNAYLNRLFKYFYGRKSS